MELTIGNTTVTDILSFPILSELVCYDYVKDLLNEDVIFAQLGGLVAIEGSMDRHIGKKCKWITVGKEIEAISEANYHIDIPIEEWFDTYADKYVVDWYVLPFTINQAYKGSEWQWISSIIRNAWQYSTTGVMFSFFNDRTPIDQRIHNLHYPDNAQIIGVFSLEYPGSVLVDYSQSEFMTSIFLIK